jgi:hypothetical protein|tara:strand:- start:73 stop:216 length:144 start_codon:yes stop_codon:yes gene_type:complete
VLCDVFVLLVLPVVLVLRYICERSDGTNKEEDVMKEWGREKDQHVET